MPCARVKRYRGVRQRQWGSWVSEIRHSISKTRIWLGTFETAKQAAKAYDEAARLMDGPTGSKTKTNFAASPNTSAPPTSSSLLSPAVRAKLQRCNCLATLQGCSSHVRTKGSSSAKQQSPTTLSSNPAPFAAQRRRQPAPAPLVCLRLDQSQEQLGVTWQSSSSSSSYFTSLPLMAPTRAQQSLSPGSHVTTPSHSSYTQQLEQLSLQLSPLIATCAAPTTSEKATESAQGHVTELLSSGGLAEGLAPLCPMQTALSLYSCIQPVGPWPTASDAYSQQSSAVSPEYSSSPCTEGPLSSLTAASALWCLYEEDGQLPGPAIETAATLINPGSDQLELYYNNAHFLLASQAGALELIDQQLTSSTSYYSSDSFYVQQQLWQ
ncbi:hypothetical protein L7F22_009917 [Adiantum nelumboides]|nr:hypothetical protein [Adiantum nelumboides]